MGGCSEGQDWEHKAVRGRARAALLSLPLGHPAGVAGQRSTHGRVTQGQGWAGLLYPFKEAAKGRKPLTQAGSWRMGGTKQSD